MNRWIQAVFTAVATGALVGLALVGWQGYEVGVVLDKPTGVYEYFQAFPLFVIQHDAEGKSLVVEWTWNSVLVVAGLAALSAGLRLRLQEPVVK